MIDRYFIRPTTVDRIRGSWLGEPIERYVTWLNQQQYASRNIFHRVPILMRFGEFARERGAKTWEELPEYISPFVAQWVKEHGKNCRTDKSRRTLARTCENPIEQMLRLVLPAISVRGRQPACEPFADRVPGFFAYLQKERGLKPTTTVQYHHFLRRLETYLKKIGLYNLAELSPVVLSAFITDSSSVMGKRSLQSQGSILKVFLAYLYREGVITQNLSLAVESPRRYRLAHIPRSISWDDVGRMLEAVDRRAPVGKRDYAVLLLLVTYGLRAREVAALTLDDIDWKRERLRVPERKGGHATAYPLSPIVGQAIVDYLQHGRPETSERALFFRATAPYTPMSWVAVSLRTACYLRKAGIEVVRAGSHTLRHTCIQHLLEAQFSLKTIGDYVGHSSPDSTAIYTKVALDALREVALGDGEEVL